MNWFTYSSIDNNLKTYNTREVNCLECKETLVTRDYEETFKECYYCGSNKLGNERIVINPNI
jgi:DNA-directed RNA polymerase subunit RPC12/RpoP